MNLVSRLNVTTKLTPPSVGSHREGSQVSLIAALLAAAILLYSTLVGGLGSAQAGTVSYAYDSLGRLIAVYDPSGNAAVYSYDAVGNLLSITNYSSGSFAGFELNSGSGTTGSNFTIYGT